MMGPQNISETGENTFYHFGMHKEEFNSYFSHYKRPIYSDIFNYSYSWGLSGDGTVCFYARKSPNSSPLKNSDLFFRSILNALTVFMINFILFC